MTPITDLAGFVATRGALHQVAQHVVAKARFVDDGDIPLMAYAGGFATPPLSSGSRVGVVAGDLVVGHTATPLTTIADAARLAGVEPGLPNDLYPAASTVEPDADLLIDRAAAVLLGAWYEVTATMLGRFAAEIADADPSPLVLWPEHFDQAFFTRDADESRRANYGASPGDAGHPEPYLYVGPWGMVTDNEYWNAPHFNGAVLSHSSLVAADDPDELAARFLRAGRQLLVG